MRRLLLALLLALPLHGAWAEALWQTLPPTPATPAYDRSERVVLNGVRLFFATAGQGRPVLLLHGGLANSDYWGQQVAALRRNHLVIVMDSRGHGRSARDARPFGYDLMADDVVALLDHLKLPRADVVGWSDGAIIGLDLAIRHPTRVGRIFAFAANVRTDGVIPDADKNPTFAAYIARAGREYARLSPTPTQYQEFVAQIGRMWATQPNWSDAQLRAITSRVQVVDGDHDEAIKRSHTEAMAAAIPGAGLLILPNTSHFAFLQDPVLFNAAMLHFLDAP
ncbi:MAG: alpha/beta fold hydrolase [Rhodospirillales bacterium]|nr:alpha/beta fold hydrolase [Rhodospirillales bacterium]